MKLILASITLLLIVSPVLAADSCTEACQESKEEGTYETETSSQGTLSCCCRLQEGTQTMESRPESECVIN